MQKVRKSRLSKRIKQAAAFAMGLILMAGSLSLDCHVAAAETKGTEVDGFTETQARGGITYTFNFADTAAAVYDFQQEASAVEGTEMKSAGLVTVNAGNQAKFHDSTHGTSNAMDIDIAVAGTVKVSVYCCTFSGDVTYAMTSSTGTAMPVTLSASGKNCDETVDFYYKGDAGSVNFKSTGGYLHKIVVTPIAESDIPDFGGGDEPDPNSPNGFVAPAPVKGTAYTFNFADTTAKIYDLQGAVMASQGTTLKSAGLVTVNAGNSAKYWNDHGISGALDINIAVAGDCKINITACAYSGDTDTYTVSSQDGTVSEPATQKAQVSKDKALVTFTYTGGEGSVNLVSTGGYCHAIEIIPIIKRENRKIEVWDFAEVQESNTTLYHNNIEPDFWKNSGLVGIGEDTGKNEDIQLEYTQNSAKTVTFGDLTMRYENGDRIYSSDVTTKTFKTFSTLAYPDGYTANGLWYGNGSGGNNRRYVVLTNVEAGDKVVVYMGSHTKENNLVHFLYQGGDAVQDDTADIGYEQGKKYEFIAKYDGAYQIYVGSSTNVKPFWHRIMVVPGAKVSGAVDAASTGVSGYGLKFVNNTTNDEITADVAGDGTFNAVLPSGYEYTAVLTGVVGYGITSQTKTVSVPDSAAIEGMSGIQLVVEQKDVQKFSGTFTGFDAGVDKTTVRVVLEAAADSQKEDISFRLEADGKFEVYVERGIPYTIKMEGANDYEITGNTEVLLAADEEREVKVAKKASYKVAGKLLGLDGNASVTSLKFVNMEDSSEYAATVSGSSYSVLLRNGTYEVEAAVTGYNTVSHVIVDSGAVNRDLLFVSTAKVTAIPFVSDIYVGYPGKGNNYSTVRDAVKACEAMRLSNANDRITVHIAPGVYREQIIIDVPYISFVNDEPEKEVKLTWYYGIGYVYYSIGADGYYSEAAAFDKFEKNTAQKWGSATYIKSKATQFRAENITFESSFNKYVTEEEIADGVVPGGNDKKEYDRTAPTADVTSKEGTERAAALVVEGNQSEFYNCKLLSSQDTLYTGNNIKGYFKNCYIEGNTDYIFGGGDFVYDGCELNFFGYSDKENGGYITAAADGSNKGYVFRNCYVTGNKDMKVGAGDLGRPWRATATVSFINTKLEYAAIILPRGWNDMSNNKAENANYAEYNTTAADGSTVDLSARVTGVKTQNPIPDVSVVFNGWTPVYYQADTDKVSLTKALSIGVPAKDTIQAGDVLTADFSLGDNEYNNVSVIRWYRVAADKSEVLIKSGVAQFDRSYTVTADDVGSYIKVEVIPETVSGYTAAGQTAVTSEAVADGKTPGMADYTAVNAAIAKANQLNAAEYENFNLVRNACDAVVFGLPATEQARVDAMAKDIEDAIASLIKGTPVGPVPVDPESFVDRLYTLVLGREPDEKGHDEWTDSLTEQRSSGVDIGYGFVFSQECKERQLSNEEFVEMLYNTYLGRPSDEGGKAAWVSQLDAGVDREKVFEGFAMSDEFSGICTVSGISRGSISDVPQLAAQVSAYRNQNADLTKFVAGCYEHAFDRTYDLNGLEDWCRTVINGVNTPKQAAQSFIFSEEFTEKKLSNEEYITTLYHVFLHREPDAEGLAAWVNVLESGKEDRAKVLDGFADSIEFDGILESFHLK